MTRPLIIAGPASGVGKTTVATGMMGAFSRQGKAVAPFKVGPDYIDPGFHQRACGAPSRNLDTWLTSAGAVRSIYERGSGVAEISVVEGVMGLFDGRAGAGGEGSTAEVARLLDGAVVLVVDCARLSRSLAPLLFGFDRFDEGISLAGVILNNVGSARHARLLRDAAAEAGVAVLGEIPRSENISLGSRHLGLVPEAEIEAAAETLDRIIGHVAPHLDLEALAVLAGGPGGSGGCGRPGAAAGETALPAARAGEHPDVSDAPAGTLPQPRARIAVARDEAFSFYYIDSLEALETSGAQLIYFSPLRDDGLPECDGLYLGGGFPEMFAGALEENAGMRRSVAAGIAAGLPAYAECGGMVYLCRGIEVEGRRHEMTGAIDSEARLMDRRQALGYVEARSRRDSILMAEGGRVRGHQFHWSAVKWHTDRLAYDCFSSRRPEVEPDGFCSRNLLATYVHIHFGGDNGAAERFVSACADGGWKN